MRVFIAVDVSEEVLAQLENLVAELKSRVRDARWVVRGSIHLTLRFLGESDEATLRAVCASMPSVARTYPAFELGLRGVGFFPSARRPRVLWAGVHHPPTELSQLQREVEAVATRHGYEPEERPFSPHLTLARFRSPRSSSEYSAVEQEFKGRDFGTSRITEVRLYQSLLKPWGAEYHVLERFVLGG